MSPEIKVKVIRFGIIALLFICVLTLQGMPDMRKVHDIAMSLGMILLFGLLVKNIWITLFVAWTVFLYCFFKFSSGQLYISNIFFGTVLYMITKVAFKKENINLFINGVLWLVFINIVLMALQLVAYDFVFIGAKYVQGFKVLFENTAPSGFMGHISTMGCLMALAIPLLLSRGSLTATIGAVGLFVPLYLSSASLCVLAGIFGFMFVLFFKIKKITWFLIILLFLSGGIYYTTKVDHLGTERFPVWKKVLKDCYVHPFTGWGLDSFRNKTPNKDFKYAQEVLHYDEYTHEDGTKYTDVTHINWWDNPHNLYISLAFEFGAVGLFIFIGFIRQNVMRFSYAVKDMNTIALFGFVLVFLAVSAGHFPIFLARCAVFIIPAFALLEVSTE